MPDLSRPLKHQYGRLLFRNKKGWQVREGHGLRWLHFSRHDVQAVMSLDDPSRLIMPYSRYMVSALLLQPAPSRLLSLGLGGAGFERFFRHFYPRLEITSVEPDTEVIQLARKFFELPADQPVMVADAESHLDQQSLRYSLIFCDIHEGTGHPACLRKTAFYLKMAQALAPNGVLALNLLTDNYPTLLKVLLAMRQVFPQVQLLDVPERNNLVILAAQSDFPHEATVLSRALALEHRLGWPAGTLPLPCAPLPPATPTSEGSAP